jgi:hypothetical protein
MAAFGQLERCRIVWPIPAHVENPVPERARQQAEEVAG